MNTQGFTSIDAYLHINYIYKCLNYIYIYMSKLYIYIYFFI